MKTRKLKYIPSFDFELFGISSAEDDYKISWQISNSLKIEFLRRDNIKISDSKICEDQIFSIFENITKTEDFNLKLISNKGNIGYLVPELKNIDYFIIISNNNEKSFIDDLLKQLRNIENISAVFKLNPESLKSKEKLLF